MLDAFIIEEIKRRERQDDHARPRLELPLPQPSQRPHRNNDESSEDEDKPQRGVIIIDYSVPA